MAVQFDEDPVGSIANVNRVPHPNMEAVRCRRILPSQICVLKPGEKSPFSAFPIESEGALDE